MTKQGAMNHWSCLVSTLVSIRANQTEQTFDQDARVRHEVGRNSVMSALSAPSIEAERQRRERPTDLRDEAVEVRVRRALDVEVTASA
jgi:hypothetical protein